MRHPCYLTSHQGEGKPNGCYSSRQKPSQIYLQVTRQKISASINKWRKVCKLITMKRNAILNNDLVKLPNKLAMSTNEKQQSTSMDVRSEGSQGSSETLPLSRAHSDNPLGSLTADTKKFWGSAHSLLQLHLEERILKELLVVNRLKSEDVHLNGIYNSKTIGRILTVQPMRILVK